MSLKSALRRVFKNEEGLYDLSTTDKSKTIEFAKGNFRRFNGGGPVNPLYSAGTGGGSPIGGISNYKDLSKKQKTQQIKTQRAAEKNRIARIKKYGYQPQGPSFVAGSGFFAGQTIKGTPSSFYSAPVSEQGGMLAKYNPSPNPYINQKESFLDKLLKAGEKAMDSATLDKFLQGIIDQHSGGTPDPYADSVGAKDQFKRSTASMRGSPGAQFSKGQAQNSPVTGQLAQAFNPRLNSALAKFLMANMGTPDVATKGLAAFTDKIAVRRPKYYSGTIKADTPTFTLPPRT